MKLAELLKNNPRVGIIGGTNGTGKQFANLFRKSGFKVKVSGRKTKTTNQELAEKSDILIFAPPLKSSVKIIEETIEHCQNPNQLILDLCSLKKKQIQAMKKAKGKVIGLHPMFGSKFKDVSGQDLIICTESEHKYCKPIKELLTSWGLIIHPMPAEEHDKLMATIQVIPHLSALISGSLFRSLGIHPEKSLRICSPVYKTELYMIGRIYSQNPSLYATIIGLNEESPEIAKQLQNILTDLIIKISKQDIDGLEAEFSENKSHFGKFAQKALIESQKLFLKLN